MARELEWIAAWGQGKADMLLGRAECLEPKRMAEHPRMTQRRLASAGGKLGQWLEEAATEWEAHGVVADEVRQRIEEKALEVAGRD